MSKNLHVSASACTYLHTICAVTKDFQWQICQSVDDIASYIMCSKPHHHLSVSLSVRERAIVAMAGIKLKNELHCYCCRWDVDGWLAGFGFGAAAVSSFSFRKGHQRMEVSCRPACLPAWRAVHAYTYVHRRIDSWKQCKVTNASRHARSRTLLAGHHGRILDFEILTCTLPLHVNTSR